jgi:hypothetical protein
VVDHHGLARRHLLPLGLLMRLQLNGGTWADDDMIRVALQSFVASGSLGPVSLGMSRARLHAELGPPDDVGGESRRQSQSRIWRYGDLEFHFGGDNLSLIYLERVSGPDAVPAGGDCVDLDPWVLVRDAPFNTVLAALQAASLPYRVFSQPDLDRTLIRFPSGVDLGFSGTIATDARLSFVSRGQS